MEEKTIVKESENVNTASLGLQANQLETVKIPNELGSEKETERMFRLQNDFSNAFLILNTVYDITPDTISLKIKTLSPRLVKAIYKNPENDYGISIGELEALNEFACALLHVLTYPIQAKITY